MNKKVLLIDDEPDISFLVAARLTALGCQVITAVDGQEGLNLARKESPDLILLDLMLPKVDGYKVCRMLKFDKAYEHIPIVIFSAKGSDADRKLAEEVGADAYLTKPFNLDAFNETVRKLLGS